MSLPRVNQRPGPLADHVRKGRVFSSPLAATGRLQIADWARDDLPDLLWPVLVLAERGTGEAVRFARWQSAVQRDLEGRVPPEVLATGLDGRLTSLDRLAEAAPDAKDVIKARADQWGLLPPTVVNALASYPLRPAEWITDAEMSPPGQDELDLIVRAVFEVLQDGHRESVIKCLSIWSAVQAGRFSSGTETIDLLKDYPSNPDTRDRADSCIRAMWGATKGAILHEDQHHLDEAIKWAKVFWGANSMTSRCVRRRDLESEPPDKDDAVATSVAARAGGVADGLDVPADGAHLRRLAMDLLASYVEALETSAARLYDHERQEVNAGLVARAGRDVITALGAPELWCMEHGSHVVRTLVETRIYLQWMALQDPSIYQSFQDYGAGKAKLYARIMDELPIEARRPDFVAAVKELEALSRNDEVIDHRVVDSRDSFADGKSIRQMAEESGLLDLYRQAYYMASGVAHSEWWSIETHVMERCVNVLHGGHLIPSLSLNSGGNVQLASSWVDQFYALIRISLEILGTDERAVTEAFEWLDADADADAVAVAEDDRAAADDGTGDALVHS